MRTAIFLLPFLLFFNGSATAQTRPTPANGDTTPCKCALQGHAPATVLQALRAPKIIGEAPSKGQVLWGRRPELPNPVDTTGHSMPAGTRVTRPAANYTPAGTLEPKAPWPYRNYRVGLQPVAPGGEDVKVNGLGYKRVEGKEGGR